MLFTRIMFLVHDFFYRGNIQSHGTKAYHDRANRYIPLKYYLLLISIEHGCYMCDIAISVVVVVEVVM